MLSVFRGRGFKSTLPTVYFTGDPPPFSPSLDKGGGRKIRGAPPLLNAPFSPLRRSFLAEGLRGAGVPPRRLLPVGVVGIKLRDQRLVLRGRQSFHGRTVRVGIDNKGEAPLGLPPICVPIEPPVVNNSIEKWFLFMILTNTQEMTIL